MPKHIIEFDLPTENDELTTAMNGGTYHSVLCEFSEWLRRKYKHVEAPSPAAHVEHEEICTKFYEFINDYNVEL